MEQGAYGRVKKSTAHAKKDPGIDEQTEAVSEGNVEDGLAAWAVAVLKVFAGLGRGGDLRAEGVEKEECCAD